MAARTKQRTIEDIRRARFGVLSGRSVSARSYDQRRRAPGSQAFYNSTRWKKLRERKKKANPLCQRCESLGRTRPMSQVHHIKKVATHPELRFEWSNLMSVCDACHAVLDRSAS